MGLSLMGTVNYLNDIVVEKKGNQHGYLSLAARPKSRHPSGGYHYKRWGAFSDGSYSIGINWLPKRGTSHCLVSGDNITDAQ